MTTERPYAALRAYDRCMAGLLADPEATGDLLLVGLWLARAAHLRDPAPTVGTGYQLADIAQAIWPLRTQSAITLSGERVQDQATGPDDWKVAEVLRRDIRRYDPWADVPGGRAARRPCGGPMVRRDACGKPCYTYAFLTDPSTGRKRFVGACRRHEDWFHAERRASIQSVRAAGDAVPRPAANAGGRLASHVPEVDWPALWRFLDKDWTPPPEMDTWAKPTLRLVVSPKPAAPVAVVPPPRRPRFALINGARS